MYATVSGVGSNAAAIDARTRTTAQVALSQLLFDFGKNLAATEVSRRLADVAKEDVEVQRDLIVLAVKEASFNLLFAKRLITVNDEALKRAELNLRSARGFFEALARRDQFVPALLASRGQFGRRRMIAAYARLIHRVSNMPTPMPLGVTAQRTEAAA